jgi:hypothetical protein
MGARIRCGISPCRKDSMDVMSVVHGAAHETGVA